MLSKRRRLTPRQKVISVWYRLVSSHNGELFINTSEHTVSVTVPARVDGFLRAVKSAFDEDGYLKGIPVALLRVYREQNAFSSGETPLVSSSPVHQLGKSTSTPLIVAVPSIAPEGQPVTSVRQSFNFIETEPIPVTVSHIGSLSHPFCVEFADNEKCLFAYDSVPDVIPEAARPEIVLPYRFVDDAGISSSSGARDVVLFVRDRCFWQMKFITYDVIGKGKIGFIQGHPGTGKSITMLTTAAALCRDEKWNILWIHVTELEELYCLRLKSDGTVDKLKTSTDHCGDLINSFVCDGKKLLIIDGVDQDSGHWETLIKPGRKWFRADEKNRRVIFLSSQEFHIDIKDQDRNRTLNRIFKQALDTENPSASARYLYLIICPRAT